MYTINTNDAIKKNGNGQIVDYLLNNSLPSDNELEESLISAIIINNSVLSELDDLNPDYFYKTSHQIIIKTIISLRDQSAPIDLVTLVFELRDQGKLEQIGGAYYVSSLVDTVPLAVNAPHYWNRIKKLYFKREDIKRANLIIKGSVSPGSVSDAEISRLKQGLIDNSFSDGVESFTAADLEKQKLPDPVWVVPGVLPEGLSILGGKPKKGKSILALNIALSVASGNKALGSVDLDQPGAVLYLSFEDKKKRLKTRISSIVEGSGWSENLIFYTSFPRMGNGGLQRLEMEIKKHDAKFVVIDTLARFRPVSGREVKNMYLDDYGYMSEIRELSSRTGCSVLVIHHLRKSGADDIFDCFSGSNGITGSVDCMLALTRSKGSLNSTLSISGNDVGDQDYALQYDQANYRWSLLGESSEVQNSDEKQILYDLFSDSPGEIFSPKQISELTGLNYQYVRKNLPDLIADGLIRKQGRGRYVLRDDTGNNEGNNHIPNENYEIPSIVPVVANVADNEHSEINDSGNNGNNGNKHQESSLDSDNSDCSRDCSNDDTGNKKDDTGNKESEPGLMLVWQDDKRCLSCVHYFRIGDKGSCTSGYDYQMPYGCDHYDERHECPGGYVTSQKDWNTGICRECQNERQWSQSCPFNPDRDLEN